MEHWLPVEVKTHGKNFAGPTQTGSEIRVWAIFSWLHHYISLILHKIAAWDKIKHLVEQKPQTKMLGWKWSFLFSCRQASFQTCLFFYSIHFKTLWSVFYLFDFVLELFNLWCSFPFPQFPGSRGQMKLE